MVLESSSFPWRAKKKKEANVDNRRGNIEPSMVLNPT